MRPRVTAKTKPSPSISGTVHVFTYARASQCAEGLHFSAFHYSITHSVGGDTAGVLHGLAFCCVHLNCLSTQGKSYGYQGH